jgi:hypothetical protein
MEVCEACGFARPAYNSCRNRHCPGCQALKQNRWLEERLARILPILYFHVVVTLHPLLRPLFFMNKARLYPLLDRIGARSAKGVMQKKLGRDVEPGITAVLHTWNRELEYHPHAHLIVTAGGLGKDGSWIESEGECLLPADELRVEFRSRLLKSIRALDRASPLELPAALARKGALEELLDRLEGEYFHAYAKRTLPSGEEAFRYVQSYAIRAIGFSNSRLLDYDGSSVVFATKEGRSVRVSVQELARRVLLHVLPRGLQRIRHYRIHLSRLVAKAIPRARAALAAKGRAPPERAAPPPDESWLDRYERLTGEDLRKCPECGGELKRVPFSRKSQAEQIVLELHSRILARAALTEPDG